MQNLINLKQEEHLNDLFQVSKVAFNIGEIIKVNFLEKARNPSYQIKLDLGPLGEKITCGQFVENHNINELLGLQVLCITNLPPIRIAGIKSEVLTLGFPEAKDKKQAILITPMNIVENGAYLSFCNPINQISYDDFTKLEIKSGTIEKIIKEKNKTFGSVNIGNERTLLAHIPGEINPKINYIGLQVPVLLNLKPTKIEDQICNSIIFSILSKNRTFTLLKTSKTIQNGLDIF